MFAVPVELQVAKCWNECTMLQLVSLCIYAAGSFGLGIWFLGRAGISGDVMRNLVIISAVLSAVWAGLFAFCLKRFGSQALWLALVFPNPYLVWFCAVLLACSAGKGCL